jgi:hypothetical protein
MSLPTPDSHALRFGPYRPPHVYRGDKLFCEIRGAVTVGGYSDAPIAWPRVKKGGSPCLILCGDLVRAVKYEALIAVAHHWGVSQTTVWKWRVALGVERWNEGSTQLMRDWESNRGDNRLARARASSRKPESLSRMSASKSVRMNGVPLDGRAVQTVREQQRASRMRLARRAGPGYTQLWRIETGRAIGLSRARAARLAKALGAPLEQIVA